MALRQPGTDESVLNMTPMIDIVFQLILFFMFNMKFKALDERLEAVMPPVGESAVPVFLPTLPSIEVVLARRAGAEGRTRVDVAGQAFDLPGGALTGDPGEDEALAERRTRVRDAVRDRIQRLRADTTLPGEIRVPPTAAGPVPHGDVMLVLDAFVDAGVKAVHFEGARRPLRRR